MHTLLNYPLLVFVLSFFMLWLSTSIGASLSRKWRKLEENAREDFGVVLAATLTTAWPHHRIQLFNGH
jgi:hypothetical protein